MSETIQLEQVLNEKAGIEEESQELDETQKQLRLKAKVLAEKIIQEMRKRNNAKQDNVNKLQSKVSELETQLNNLSLSTAKGNQEFPTDDDGEQKASETFDEALEEASDDTVTVTEVAEEPEELDKQDKRKRRLF